MLRNWKLQVSVNRTIINNLKDSTVKALKQKFGNIKLLRRSALPIFLINDSVEVVVGHDMLEIFSDNVDDLINLDVQYILNICYNSPVILRVDIGNKIIVSCTDQLKVAKKLNSIVENKVHNGVVMLSSTFGLVKDDDIIVYTIVLNDTGYHLQLELNGIQLKDIKSKINELIELRETPEIVKILNIEE